ncbi:MAG: hypothetical protein J7J94_04175, partial [Thaumarchaeota archaeon]|nr:hypothetical protein [Nitrososphaerota archaeon]
GTVLLLWLWALLKRTGIILITESSGGLSSPQVFLLIITAILGMAAMSITILITRILSKTYSKYFKKRPKH